MLLTEYYPLNVNKHLKKLNESTISDSNSPMILERVVVQRANSKNRNGRVYPKDILKREIDKFVENMVNFNRALGELDHSQENVVNLKNVSHNIKKIYWEGDDVLGDIEILDGPEFPAGRIAAGLLRRNIPVGISSRGIGSVSESADGTSTVDDFNLLTWDLVSFESTQGANMGLNEGVDITIKDSYKRIDDILRELICNNSGYCPC